MTADALQTHRLPTHTVRYAVRPPSAAVPRTPLILLHGGAVDHRMWGPQLDAFDDRLVVAPDARGHGGSSDADTAYRLADDVVELLDALEIERAVLVGLSMGGGTAVDVALEHPTRVAGLVVSGTGTSEPEFTDPWSLQTFTEWQEAQDRGDAEAWIATFLRFAYGPERSREDLDPEVVRLVETMARETLAEHLEVDAKGIPVAPTPPTQVTDTWQRLTEVSVPVLALAGSLDGEDHRSMGRRLVDSVADGDYVEVAGAHYPNLESPAEFTRAMGDWLERHGL